MRAKTNEGKEVTKSMYAMYQPRVRSVAIGDRRIGNKERANRGGRRGGGEV